MLAWVGLTLLCQPVDTKETSVNFSCEKTLLSRRNCFSMLSIFLSSMGCDAHPHNIFQHITNFQFNEVQAYRLLSANSGMALDVTDASVNDGAKLQQWPFNNGPNQRWTITQSSDGSYEIVNQNSDRALEAPDNIDAPIQQGTPSRKPAQRWQMVGQTDGSYAFCQPRQPIVHERGLRRCRQGGSLATSHLPERSRSKMAGTNHRRGRLSTGATGHGRWAGFHEPWNGLHPRGGRRQ